MDKYATGGSGAGLCGGRLYSGRVSASDITSAQLRWESPHFPGQRGTRALSHPPARCPGRHGARSGDARLPVPASVSCWGQELCPAVLVALGGHSNKAGLGLPLIPPPPPL